MSPQPISDFPVHKHVLKKEETLVSLFETMIDLAKQLQSLGFSAPMKDQIRASHENHDS